MATKTLPNPHILYQNRLWENLTPDKSENNRILLQAVDWQRPIQVMIDPKDLEKKCPKKKPGEHYKLMYGTEPVFSDLSYPLVEQKKHAFCQLPQYQKLKLQII